jgi:hypothetical protein
MGKAAHQEFSQIIDGHATGRTAIENDRLVATKDFDFDEIDRRLGFESPEQPIEFSDMTACFSLILGWICKSRYEGSITNAGWKAQSLLWLLDPQQSKFESLSQIAEAEGVTKQAVSKALLELRDECGFLISAGKSQTARESYSKAQFAAVDAGCHSRNTRKDSKAERISLEAVPD